MAVKTKRQKFVGRANVVFAAICIVGFLGCVASLAFVSLFRGEKFRSMAAANQLRDTYVAAERGVIYDCNMTALAESSSTKIIYIKPSLINGRVEVINYVSARLAQLLHLDTETIVQKCKNDTDYEKIKSGVPFEIADKIQLLRSEEVEYMDGGKTKKCSLANIIGIDPDVRRYYSNPTLASSVLGFIGTDYNGLKGIESYYDTELTGVPGRIISAQTGRGTKVPIEYKNIYDSQKGTSLCLTIDEHIQTYLENALEQTYINTSCESVLGILMDVNTGAVLAMGSRGEGCYDMTDYRTLYTQSAKDSVASAEPNQRTTVLLAEQERQWRNICVSSTYEPGSVFKVFTAASVLEEGICTVDEQFTCVGSIPVAGRNYLCHRESGHGTQDLRHGLMNSCNPFFISLGMRIKIPKFIKYLEGFGFSEKTGIDLPSEENSVLHSFAKFSESNLASCSFGQTFNVTPIQMITALSCIANGGKLMKPYVVAKQIDADGNVIHETKPIVRRNVISKQTAAAVADMMESVVQTGTGKNAYIAGYRVAGKTGTSDDTGAGDGIKHYWASFGCFAPANDPKVAMLVVIRDPVGAHGGGAIAAPVAAQVLSSVLPYMDVELQYTEKELENLEVETKSVVGMSVAEAKAALSENGFRIVVKGDGDVVVSQIPTGGQNIPKDGTIILYTTEQAEKERTIVPDLSGLSIRQATERALASGINIKIVGNTLLQNEMFSYQQSVAPGTSVHYGEIITVHFKSNMGITDSRR